MKRETNDGENIKNYVGSNGVNLVKYMNEIKKIDQKERMSKAPRARLVKDGIIASFPLNHPSPYKIYPCWVEYKIEYKSYLSTVDVYFDVLVLFNKDVLAAKVINMPSDDDSPSP